MSQSLRLRRCCECVLVNTPPRCRHNRLAPPQPNSQTPHSFSHPRRFPQKESALPRKCNAREPRAPQTRFVADRCSAPGKLPLLRQQQAGGGEEKPIFHPPSSLRRSPHAGPATRWHWRGTCRPPGSTRGLAAERPPPKGHLRTARPRTSRRRGFL